MPFPFPEYLLFISTIQFVRGNRYTTPVPLPIGPTGNRCSIRLRGTHFDLYCKYILAFKIKKIFLTSRESEETRQRILRAAAEVFAENLAAPALNTAIASGLSGDYRQDLLAIGGHVLSAEQLAAESVDIFVSGTRPRGDTD